MHTWLMLLLAVSQATGISFNLPKICPSATWNPKAITFANSSTLRSDPWVVFVNKDDTIAVTVPSLKQVLIWFKGNATPTKMNTYTSIGTFSVFVTTNNDMYVNDGIGNGYVYKWNRNGTAPTVAMTADDVCYSLFVDVNENLYCCLGDLHQVVRKLSSATSITPIRIAGRANSGSSSRHLDTPRGIFVDLQLNLYVADCANNRIQRFSPNSLTGTTVAGYGAAGTINLNEPTGVILDANGYIFIADFGNDRIVGSGPHGFRCIVGCTGSLGSASNQLYEPWALSFDSRGNLFVSDSRNNRIQKFTLKTSSCKLSFNQPKFCASATWDPNATTFANSSSVGNNPVGIFVDTNDNVYVPATTLNQVQVWQQGNMNTMSTVPNVPGHAYDVFLNTDKDIFINSVPIFVRVDKWIHNATNSISVMNVNHACFSLFLDIFENLYCSLGDMHMVVRKWFVDDANSTTIIAGNGSNGSTSYMLNFARGIFVDAELNLYVADLVNNRIQLFTFGNLSGTSVAGNEAPGTIDLNWPTDVALDADGYLFIVEFYNFRIVGSSANGFRCIVGCTGISGSASDQLSRPWSFSFDSVGNLFVTDYDNSRIQKFSLVSNFCGVSYNLPKLSPCASWNPMGVTVVDVTAFSATPTGIFVTVNNVIYLVGLAFNRVRVWSNGSAMPSTTIASNLTTPYSVFVTVTGDVYVDNGANGRIEKWTNNGTKTEIAMYVESVCYSLFVDVNDNLYCCLGLLHKVVKKLSNTKPNVTTIVAGNGTPGSAPDMLNNPTGIYVDTELNLYVADCSNNRVQRFQFGNPNGTTIAGNGTPGTIGISCPNAVMLDGDGYVYVLEYHHSRIFRSTSDGFRCIIGCLNGNGSAADQMIFPWSFSFDSDGNILVVDSLNNRIQKFLLTRNSCDVSYNQPKFSSCATWNPNATTFANNNTVGASPYSIFVDTNDTVYVPVRNGRRISVWSTGSVFPTRNISLEFNVTLSVFATTNGDVFADNGLPMRRVYKWSLNSTNGTVVMDINAFCHGMFVDISNTLYCSVGLAHVVKKTSLYRGLNSTTIAAGTGTNGSAPDMLSEPRGIFVDITFSVYVADCGNDRIQLFRPDNVTGTTVVGNGALGTISLNCPVGLAIDGDGYLFVVDGSNNRLIGSGPNGFRCIVGCTGTFGQAPNQLYWPRIFSFDSYGNLFIVDTHNNRIQKFLLINSTCEETTMATEISTISEQTSMPTIASQTITGNQSCFPPTITLIPSTSSLLQPLQFRRSQDFYISSNIQLNCSDSFSTAIQWTVKNCTSSCSSLISVDPTIATTYSELYIPARTLPFGLFELQLTVTMTISSNLTSSASAYVKINPSGITANLVRFGTSMITRGHEQDLTLDPGSFSVDYDTDTFNASDWTYDYFCRIYGLYNFPHILGVPLSIDDPRVYSDNGSCLTNRSSTSPSPAGNITPWKYNGVNASIKSALIILSGSLASNRTYQFMVRMENRHNMTNQATGYLLVRVDDTRPQMVLIACVISTLCVPNVEFQLVNPTTQVALFSLCSENCSSIINTTWNIYQGINGSMAIVQWALFNQIDQYENIWFFGRNTTNFTALNRLFSEYPQIQLWRFEVIYTFASEISSSALNFLINQSPANGSCTINPHNGTTTTLFSISCPDWFDQDGIKDYSIYSYTTDRTEQIMIAYSSVSDFTVYLPAGAENTSILHTIVYIRDTLDCFTEYNTTSISVRLDTTEMKDLINTLQANTNSAMNNSLALLLLTGNPYTTSQVINAFSQSFNQMNTESIQNAISGGLPATSISISSLGSTSTQQTTLPFNATAQQEYNQQLNSFANVRDYLMPFVTSLPITGSSSIKLQASSVAQLTQATNQLTRTASIIASKKCYELARALNTISSEIAYENVQTTSTQIAQCASNVLSAINGPLQHRTNVLNLDSTRANALPVDYDTDLEFEWSKLYLFAEGTDFSSSTIEKNRNIYFQKQQADQIVSEMIETMSLLTNALKIHLNLGQNSTMNTSSVFMSLETLSTESLHNKIIQPVGNAQIHLPENFQVNSTGVSLRSIMQPLAPAGDSPNTYLSRSLSLSIYDQNGNEMPVQSTENQSIEIIIPRDPNFVLPPMNLQNVTSSSSTPHQQLFNLHFVNITSKLPISIHFEMLSHNTNLAYLLIYKFDGSPQLNSSIRIIDGWSLLCPSNQSIHTYFLDNQRTMTHQSIVFGLRELNSTNDCFNHSITEPSIFNEPFHFSANYELRVYTSGCYYLDKDNRWQSDGLIVGSRTNHQFTQCFSTHLTTFTSSFNVLSQLTHWNYVFSMNDYPANPMTYFIAISFIIAHLSLLRYLKKRSHIK